MADVNSPTQQMLAAALRNADASVQLAESKVTALVEGVKAMLLQPDSGLMRVAIAELCGQIRMHVNEAGNSINASAEQLGCSHVDDLAINTGLRLSTAANTQSPLKAKP